MEESAARTWWRVLVVEAIVVAVLVVFLPTLDNGFVGWDDQAVLVENPHYRGFGVEQLRWMFSTYHAGHFQPVTWLTYAADWTVWGMNPLGYHLTNNLFHALNALLVYLLAVRLLRRAFSTGDPPAWWMIEPPALLAALLFALHPLRVESVAWATERRDLVSASLILLTVLAYLRSTSGPRRLPWLAVTLGLYVVSMLAKIGGAPLPIVLLALDWYPLRRLHPRRFVVPVLEKLPFLAVALAFSLATVRRQSKIYMIPWEDHDLLARCAQACYGLVFYPLKTVLPTDLLPLYEIHLPLDPFEARYVASAIVVAVVGVAALLLRRRCPALLAALLVYGAMIGPLLGFFQNGPQIVADRYSYLSCLGLPLLVAGAVGWRLRRGAGPAGRGTMIAASVVVLAALGALTWRQCGVWRSTETLWGYMIDRAPDSAYANNGWGCVLQAELKEEEAIRHFRRAIEIKRNHADAWYNLWNALGRLDRDTELRESLVAGTAVESKAVRGDAHYRIGRLALERGEHAAALASFEEAIALRRAHAPARVGAGRCLVALGRPDEAAPRFRLALEIDPDLVAARIALAELLIDAGRLDEAEAELRRVLEREPRNIEAHAALRRLKTERSTASP